MHEKIIQQIIFYSKKIKCTNTIETKEIILKIHIHNVKFLGQNYLDQHF
jgi:hypothetical protein